MSAPRRTPPEVGPDNLKIGDRLKFAMNAYAKQHGRDDWRSYPQVEWIALATQAVRKDPETEPVMTQQNLSLILSNKSAGEQGLIAFAQLLGVESTWLEYGFGPRNYLEKQLQGSAK